MKFIIAEYTHYFSSKGYKGPCVVLMKDSWDDYGHKTTFIAKYIDENDDLFSLGAVKILDRYECVTKLDNQFTQLSNNYCSLGSSMDYYEKISLLPKSTQHIILKSLNDVAINNEIYENFRKLVGFSDSLLRNGRNALNNAKAFLESKDIKNKMTFTYSTRLEGAENSHSVDFSFYRDDGIPYRVFSIIGKNGTGKTRYLADLTSDLTSDYKDNHEKFGGNRPSFGMILGLSYSAFTQFQKEAAEEANSDMYKYFGALDNENRFSTDIMEDNLRESVERIIEFKRVEFWLETLRDIQDEEFATTIKRVIVNEGKYDKLSGLSSGQRMIFEIITNILAHVRINTLIVFDEPEIHLHPNAISKLMKALYSVLEQYDSFAILATHIPHVIQQIPSDSVVVFERTGNVASVRKLRFESFGENLSELTNSVFETNNVFDNYKNVLKKLMETMDYDDVNELFGNKLSLNAKVFLKSCEEEVLEMKKLKAYEDNQEQYYEGIRSDKRMFIIDPETKEKLDIKDILDTVKSTVFTSYKEYNNKRLTLEMLCESTCTPIEKDALHRCYNNKTESLNKLKSKIKEVNSPEVGNTCQFCGINSANTFDHYVPKEDYPEFSVYGPNLIPCCGECNSYKGKRWKDSERKFINLYYDDIPDIEIIEAKIEIEDDVPKVEYKFKKNQHDEYLVDLLPNSYTVRTHYEKLQLNSRFSYNCNNYISEIKRTFDFIENSTAENVEFHLNSQLKVSKEVYGVNHWRTTLIKGMLDSSDFVIFCINK